MIRDHHILLVEDDADDALLIERAIRKSDGAVPIHRVADGQAACDYLSGTGPYADRSAHPLPTVVLLDIKLPKRSGLEVLKWIRGTPGLDRLVVVMMTSSKEPRDVDEAYANRVNSYLVKPIAPADMQAVMRTLCAYWLHCNEPPEGGLQPPSRSTCRTFL
jgi:CheY-like chemotaxis protein